MLAPPSSARPAFRVFLQLALVGCLLAVYPLLASTPSMVAVEQVAADLDQQALSEPAEAVGAARPISDLEPAADEPGTISAAEPLAPLARQLSISPQPSSAFLDVGRRSAPVSDPREVATIPIVMYHHIDDLPRNVTDVHRKELTVSVANFRRQLELLVAMQATTVGLAEVMDYLEGGEPLPSRPVVLTFDDGYDDNYRFAYPLLRQFRMSGTFFVVANLVGKPGYMSWDQLREMQVHGMAIESHSLDHLDLSSLPRAEVQRQLVESRRILERNLLRPVRYLNYPSGRYSRQVIATARAAGYEAAVTTEPGLVQERTAPYQLSRVRVSGSDTAQSLAAKMVPTFWKYPPRGQFAR